MKKILLLIPNLGFGGAQRVFHDHSVELGNKYQVYDCVFNKDDGIAYPTPNELIDLEVPGGGNVVSKMYYFLLRIIRLRRIKKQYRIDVCISHLEGADYVNLLSRVGEKTMVCIHGSKLHDKDISGRIGWIRKAILMPWLYKRPDKIITVSRDINQELIEGFGVDPGRVMTINNFFDLPKITALAVEPLEERFRAIFQDAPVLITSGRLAVQKNQQPLLPILAQLLQRGRSCKLVIIGDGDLRQDLVATAKELKLRVYEAWREAEPDGGADVYFLGFHHNPFQFIRQGSVFVFPSSWEGFPMALGEAMICGLPVVSTDCPTGPREMLAPKSRPGLAITQPELAEYGILLPLFTAENFQTNIGHWVAVLERLLAEPDLRQHYARQAQLRMADFEKGKVFARWEQAIESL